MFKINITHKNTYAEIDQANPLRWRIMHRDKQTLTSQSGLMKCKDFFNDVVAWRKSNKKFGIYSFQNDIKFNRAGVYFILSHIYDKKMFLQNLSIVNERLKTDLNVKISTYSYPKDSTRLIIHIPNALWESTYRISLVTMLIRVCNYNMVYTTWDEIFSKDAPMCTTEKAFNPETIKFTQENGFILPEKFQKYWYFARFGWNSEAAKPITPTVIHNNGCTDWCTAMKEAK